MRSRIYLVLTEFAHVAGMGKARSVMRWWFYALLLAIPVVLGENNARAGGEFLPVLAAALFFAVMAVGAMEAMSVTRRALRRQQANATPLKRLRHHAA
jgi:hypothetical protein